MEYSLAFATLPSSSSSWTANPKPKFCAQGCVKCSPVSLSLRSSSLSSSKRSECSSSSSTSWSESLWYGDHQLKAIQKATNRINNRPVRMRSVRVVFVGSENGRDTDAHVTNEEPKRLTNGHANGHAAGSSIPGATREDVVARGFNPNGVTTTSSVVEKTATEQQHVDEIWLTIKAEARLESEKEPVLASFFYSSVISHRCVH